MAKGCGILGFASLRPQNERRRKAWIASVPGKGATTANERAQQIRRRFPAGSTSTNSSLRKVAVDRFPRIPILRRALEKFALTIQPVGPVIRCFRGSHLRANSVVDRFVALYKELGFEDYSSHSGRRSFITIAEAREFSRIVGAELARSGMGAPQPALGRR
jgi:hypothetical protein